MKYFRLVTVMIGATLSGCAVGFLFWQVYVSPGTGENFSFPLLIAEGERSSFPSNTVNSSSQIEESTERGSGIQEEYHLEVAEDTIENQNQDAIDPPSSTPSSESSDQDTSAPDPLESPGIERRNSKGEAIVYVMAYLRSDAVGVSGREEYENFLERVSDVYEDEGIKVEFRLAGFEGASSCPTDKKSADLSVCIGSGVGGYYGPPIKQIGHNTDSPFGFSNIGLLSMVHEFGHFLGVQDLYWTRISNAAQPSFPSYLTTDLMFDSYTASNGFNSTVASILNRNADRIASGQSIIEVKDRMPKSFRVMTGAPSVSCQLYSSSRDYSLFKNKLATTSQTVTTDAQGAAAFLSFSTQNNDNNFDVYRFTCGEKDMWIHTLHAERCYARGDGSECRLSCEAGGWCPL